MAERDTSFLFSGTSFNRKKFPGVFDRFKVLQLFAPVNFTLYIRFL